jgi:hemerythrin-like domain-containing protein
MIADPPRSSTEAEAATPIEEFTTCHAGVLAVLRTFSTLPPLHDAAQRARKVAQDTLDLMNKAVLEHHAEEEEELFPAVLRSAARGEERDRVHSLIWRLCDEHREIEELWKRLRPEVAHAAAGKPADLRQEHVDVLISSYRQHAQTEERDFLPMAREILSRDGNHMAALEIAMHLRHRAAPIAYL